MVRFGTPLTFGSILVFEALFTSGRCRYSCAPPLVAFRFDHPAFLISLCGVALSALLMLFGWRLTQADRPWEARRRAVRR